MIGQVVVLLKVKKLKESQALRELEVRRAQAARAAADLRGAEERVRKSAETLPARERAIYQAILGRVVELDVIDDAKAKVLALEHEHEKLVAERERCAHVLARCEKDLEAALAHHRQTVKDRDKYVMLTDQLVAEEKAIAEQREEAEIEDLSTGKRRRLS